MAKKRQPFTFESHLDEVIEKVNEKPKKVMGIIGGQLKREIKSTTLKEQFKHRRKILAHTLEWAYGWDEAKGKKDKASIQIGFKLSIPGIVNKMMTHQEPDPILPVVKRNKDYIQKLIAEALDEIRKE